MMNSASRHRVAWRAGLTAALGWMAMASPASRGQAADTPTYQNPAAPVEQRVTDLISRLTLDEKIHLLHSNFTSGGVPRLGIPPLLMLDGRQGLRPVDHHKGTQTTLLPCILALSCTWDDQAAHDFGRTLAEEMLAMDRHVLLAPMLNLVRSPLGGRNFENFGEDPLLVGTLGAAYVRGVQELGVAACACLLVANDCEHRRHFTSSNMDERTLRELHLLGYELSVRDGQVWSMMTGNNLYNGLYCAQNPHLIQNLIKDQIGFDGAMITDWRAAYDTLPTALAGTDMTTGFCSYVFGDGRLLAAVNTGQVSKELLDDKVRRVVRLYARSGALDPAGSRKKGGIDTPEHRAAARRLGAAGMVLLKNDGNLLPLDPATTRRVLITGPGAATVLQGGGSGSVPAAVQVTPVQGLRDALPDADVTHLPYNVPLRPRVEKAAVEWEQTASTTRRPATTRPSGIPSPDELAAAARDADVVLFVAAGTLASEGRDLPDMSLPGGQAHAIATLAAANPRTVVALASNGAVSTDTWADKVPALLAIHYAGQATGHALADVLTGAVNPSAKLSYTFAKRLDDYPAHALGQWPAKLILDKDPVSSGFTPQDRKATHAFTTEYPEGVFAGHRWFDSKNIDPAYPLGHGLSYTTFQITDLAVTDHPSGAYQVTCTVKNTGPRAGAEVVQVYVAPKSKPAVDRPTRELKGFARVPLQPGQQCQVTIPLRPSALAYFDVPAGKWKIDPGDYEIQLGASSRDIRQTHTLTVPAPRHIDHY